MLRLSERGSGIDPVLLGEELRRDGVPEQVVSVASISELDYGVPHFTNIAAYAKVIKDKSLLRQFIKVANKTAGEGSDEEDKAPALLERFDGYVSALKEECRRSGRAGGRTTSSRTSRRGRTSLTSRRGSRRRSRRPGSLT